MVPSELTFLLELVKLCLDERTVLKDWMLDVVSSLESRLKRRQLRQCCGELQVLI